MPQYNVNTLSQRGRIQEPLPVLLDRLTVGVYCRSSKMSNNGISQKKTRQMPRSQCKVLSYCGNANRGKESHLLPAANKINMTLSFTYAHKEKKNLRDASTF